MTESLTSYATLDDVEEETFIGFSEYTFLYDARRFILKNRQIADAAPLQLYSSGLMFAPRNSITRKIFNNELSTWHQLPKVEETWDAGLQTLERHSYVVESVALSPDSQLLASGSDDRNIRLWDTATGNAARHLRAILTQ